MHRGLFFLALLGISRAMANEKILIFESAWSERIEDTRSTHEIYSSAETLLGLGPSPVRIIQRPLVSSTYLEDIEKFITLECNKKGLNIIIFSTHGYHTKTKTGKHRRELESFDQEIIDISAEIRNVKGKLSRTIIVLDSCEVGKSMKSFRAAAQSMGAIGFTEDVGWVDSSVFILALLLNFQEAGVFDKKQRKASLSRAKRVIDDMLASTYSSLRVSLGIDSSFDSS